MPPKTPGIDLDKMKMPPDEKQELSPRELRSQVEREVYLHEVVEHRAAENVARGSQMDLIHEGNTHPYQKEIANEIRNEALRENFHRARVEEEVVKSKINGHRELTPTEEAQIADLHKKLEAAYRLWEEGQSQRYS